jgi:CheY-like chemotaxis protein
MLFLYVEDDSANRYIMELLFTYEIDNMQLITMADSVDFEKRIDKLSPRPAAFLLDLHLKPLNGFEMIKIIRSHPAYQSAKVIAVTASTSDIIPRMIEAGFDGSISKPIRKETFAEVIESILKGDPNWG